MRIFLLLGLLWFTAQGLQAQAQTDTIPYLKDLFAKDTTYLTADAANIKFPVRGKVKITPTPYPQYVMVEFWVYDGTGREIYYANHAAPTSASTATLDKYIEQADRMVEKEYAAFMRRQGRVLRLRQGYKRAEPVIEE